MGLHYKDGDGGEGLSDVDGVMEESLTATLVPVEEDKTPTGSDLTVPVYPDGKGGGGLGVHSEQYMHLRCGSNMSNLSNASMASTQHSNRSSLKAHRRRTHTQIFNDIVNTPTFTPVPLGSEVPPAIALLTISCCIASKLCTTALLFPPVEKLMKCDYDSEQLVSRHEANLRASRPLQSKIHEYMYTNNHSYVADMIQSILAVISSVIYVYESYQVIESRSQTCTYDDFIRLDINGTKIPVYSCMTNISTQRESLLWVRIVESVFAVIFAIDYLIRLYIAPSKLRYFFSLFAMVDLVTIMPVILAWLQSEKTASLGFIRIIRLLRLLRVLKAYRIVDSGRGHWNAIKQANALIFTVVSLLFVASGLVQLVEREQNLTFGDAVYFMVVTLATVGYGDIKPETSLGKMVMVLLILTAIILIPVQTRSLIDLLSEQPKEIFKDIPGGDNGYVIVAGHNISHDEVYMFVKEFYHPLHNSAQPPGAIIVSQEPVSPKLRLLMGSRWYKRRMRFVLGSLLDDDTLRKVKASNAKACFVIAAGKEKDVHYEPGDNGITAVSSDTGLDIALQTHNFRSFTKYQVETYCLLKNSSGRSTATAASADYIVSLDESRLKLMAQSCICPGLSTLVINFITSFREDKEADRAKLRSSKVKDRSEYERGMSHVVYEMQVPKQLVDKNFIEAAIAVYMKFEIVLLGVMNTEKLADMKETSLGTSWSANTARRQSTLKGLREMLDDNNIPLQSESGFNFVLNPGHRYRLQADDILAVLAIDLATCEVCQEYDQFPLTDKVYVEKQNSFYKLGQSAALHLSRRRMGNDFLSVENRRRLMMKRKFKALVWAIVSLWKLRPVKASLVERTVLDVNAAIVKYRHYVYKRETAPSSISGSPVMHNLTMNSSPVLAKLDITPGIGSVGRDRGLSMTSMGSTMGRARGMSMTGGPNDHAALAAMVELDLQSKIVELSSQLVAKDAYIKELMESAGTAPVPIQPLPPPARREDDLLGASQRSFPFTDAAQMHHEAAVTDLKAQLAAKELLLKDLVAQLNPAYFSGFRRTDWRKEGVFKDHIIVTGGQKHLGQFMRALKRSLCATKTSLKTVLYLAPRPPDQEVWNRVAHYRYFYFCQGDPKLTNDLYRAGLEDASSLVILASDVVEKVPDADAVFITMAAINLCPVDVEATKAAARMGGVVSKGLAEKLEKGTLKNRKGIPVLRRSNGKPLFISAELTQTSSVKYFNDFDVLQATRSFGLTPAERMELRLKTDWRKANPIKSDSFIDEEVEAFSSSHQQSPFYSAGYLISNQMLGPILPHSYYSPSLIRIVEQFMQGSLNQYGSFLGSVPVPDMLTGHTYGELFYSMALKSEMIPLGLYRAQGRESKSPLPYVFTNPPKHTVLREGDQVYVLQSGKDISEESSDEEDESFSNTSLKVEPYPSPLTPSPVSPLKPADFVRTEKEVHFHPTEPIAEISPTPPPSHR